MRFPLLPTLAVACVSWLAMATMVPAHAAAPVEVAISKPAPDFTAIDSNGKAHHLADYKGKIVVLEWTNPGCPFVKKHYSFGNMQGLQKESTTNGVVWLSVSSSAKDKEGYLEAATANQFLKDAEAHPTALLLDAKGDLGHLYGAKTTPHMFIIAADGTLAYQGAIDSVASTNAMDIRDAKNYVREALDALRAGKPVPTASTPAYGCSVKY